MKNGQKFPALLNTALFDDVPAEQAEAILNRFRVRIYEPKMPLVIQGNAPDLVFLIAHGSVEVSHASDDGAAIVVCHTGAGELLGDIEAVSESPYLASCSAATVVTALTMPVAEFNELVRTFDLLRNVARISHQRLDRDNINKHVSTYYSAEQRLCASLVQVADRGGQITRSQSYLASMVGCTRQTVNRELARLKDEGIIAIDKRTISIIDFERMNHLAGVAGGQTRGRSAPPSLSVVAG